MPEPRRCCLFLLVAVFAGLSLGTGIVLKSGCRGDNLELYHISFDNNFTLVFIYKINTQIAMLTMKNTVLDKKFSNEYKDKMSLDTNGNIGIRKLDISDEAKYIIKIDKTNVSYHYEVQLVVLVPPTTNCKPKIIRVDDVLTVNLEAKYCGRPVPSVHWLNHSGTFFEETKVIKLPPGKQAGIYHACIEGDALTCANCSKLSEYCSVFIVDEGQPLPSKEAANLRNNTVEGQPLPGQEGAGVLRNNTEQPSSGQEGAGNIRDNTVQSIDQSESHMTSGIFLTLVICLPLLIFGVIMCAICQLVRRIRKQNRNQIPINQDEIEMCPLARASATEGARRSDQLSQSHE